MTQTQKTTWFTESSLLLLEARTEANLQGCLRPGAGWVGCPPLRQGHHGWGWPLLACFLDCMAAWAWELEREQREGRSGERREGGSCRKEVAATKVNNLRLHGKSCPPSPPGPDGELAPHGTGHLCNSALPVCVSIRIWPQPQWVCIGPACLVLCGAGLVQLIPASSSSLLWVRSWCTGKYPCTGEGVQSQRTGRDWLEENESISVAFYLFNSWLAHQNC
jgi:hypothetical protein